MPSLLAVLGLDASSFQATLIKSQKFASLTGREIGQSLMSPIKGALGAFALAAAIKGAFDLAERIKSLSREFRVSTDTVQMWDLAARHVGMTAEDLGAALNRLKKAREEAVGSGSLGGFKAFNIPMEALRDSAISTEQVLQRMIQVAGGGKITDAQDVAGMEVMGRSGARILSAFQQLHDLGPVTVLTDQEIEKMHEANEQMEEFHRHSTVAIGATVGWLGKFFEEMGTEYYKLYPNRIRDTPSPGQAAPKKPLPPELLGPAIQGMTVAETTELKRVQLDIAEKIFQNSLKTATVEQKRVLLNKQIAEHFKAAHDAFKDNDLLTGYNEQLKIEELRGELGGIKDASGHRLTRDVNALQSIGAYAPKQQDEQLANSRQLLGVVREIAGKVGQHRHVGGF